MELNGWIGQAEELLGSRIDILFFGLNSFGSIFLFMHCNGERHGGLALAMFHG